jgi:hypothetical protein
MMKRQLAAFFACALAAVMAWAAGPMPDTIDVTFDMPVIVNRITLPPGQYEFQRANDTTPAYFKIFNSKGEELGMTGLSEREAVGTASAMSTVNQSEVVVDEVNGKFYLDTIYIRGMNKGFQFQQADELRSELDNAHQQGKVKHIPITLKSRQ